MVRETVRHAPYFTLLVRVGGLCLYSRELHSPGSSCADIADINVTPKGCVTPGLW
jgi:hypothetical protein